MLVAALAAVSLSAQNPAPAPESPPYLDDPDHWDIHGPNGDIGLEIEAEYLFFDGYYDVYALYVTGVVNGEPYNQVGLALDDGDGSTLEVWSGDSGNWIEWEWQGDHYKKQGGTSHVRTYHPVY